MLVLHFAIRYWANGETLAVISKNVADVFEQLSPTISPVIEILSAEWVISWNYLMIYLVLLQSNGRRGCRLNNQRTDSSVNRAPLSSEEKKPILDHRQQVIEQAPSLIGVQRPRMQADNDMEM